MNETVCVCYSVIHQGWQVAKRTTLNLPNSSCNHGKLYVEQWLVQILTKSLRAKGWLYLNHLHSAWITVRLTGNSRDTVLGQRHFASYILDSGPQNPGTDRNIGSHVCYSPY